MRSKEARIAGSRQPYGLRDRPRLQGPRHQWRYRLLRDAAQRKFDMVMAWSVDRLGRSLQDLVSFLSELHALHIDLFLHQQGLDTTTPGGKAMFQMMGVFAEFERAMIAERVRAGLRRAKREGKQLGRPRIARPVGRNFAFVFSMRLAGRSIGGERLGRFGFAPRAIRPAKTTSASPPITSCILLGFAEGCPQGFLPLLQ
jgi:hypothetical protein